MSRKKKYNEKNGNSKNDNINDDKKALTKSIDNKTNSRDYIAIITELFISLPVANGMAVLTGLISVYISFGFSIIILILACIPIAILSGMYSVRLFPLFIFTAMLGISVSYPARDYYALTSGQIIEQVPVSMAPQYRDVSAYVFTNAIVRSEYIGEKIGMRRGASDDDYTITYAVPLVSPDWTKYEPVPAWAVSYEFVYRNESRKNPRLLFDIDFNAAVTAWGGDDFNDAIEDACEKYGLISSKNAPVLKLVYSLEEEIDDVVSLLKGFFIGFNVVWIIIFLIISWRISV